MNKFQDELTEMIVALEFYQDWELKEAGHKLQEFDIDNCTAAQIEEYNQDMRHYVNKGVWL